MPTTAPAPRASINALNGDITGTPTTGGMYPVTITATDNAGYSNTTTFTWTITNTVTVTNPGDQSSVSGSPITALAISATDSSSTATLSYCRQRTLPPGLSIDPTSGSITGTPTTAGTYPVTITATDSAGFTGTTTFTWTITNTITVTNPGAQSNVSGSPITAVAISATDSSSTATLTYSDGGTLPPGLSIDPASGSITGTPTTGGVYPVTITATDDSGASASASFTWTITNTVSVTNPGAQSNVSGTAITAVPHQRHRLLVDGHPHLLRRRHPAAGPVHRPVQRLDHRHADHGRLLPGHHHRHRQRRLLGEHHLHLDHHQHGVGDQPG